MCSRIATAEDGEYAVQVSPRRRAFPDDRELERLRRAAEAKAAADAELKAAVVAAAAAGGSVRVIAETSGLSTRTIQNWLKD
jgi:predicted butyrate kinase (DUF1464 family)